MLEQKVNLVQKAPAGIIVKTYILNFQHISQMAYIMYISPALSSDPTTTAHAN